MLKDLSDRIVKTISIVSIICLLVIASYTAIVFISSRSVSEADKQRVEGILQKAQEDITGREFVSAIDGLKEGLKIDPSDARLYTTMAQIYEIKRDYQRGIDFLTSSPVSVVNKTEVARVLGRLYCLNNDSNNCVNSVKEFADFSNPQYEEKLMIERLMKDGNVQDVSTNLRLLKSCKSDVEKELIVYKVLFLYDDLEQVKDNLDLCGETVENEDIQKINNYLVEVTEITDEKVLSLSTMSQFANILVGHGFNKSAISLISTKINDISNYWEPLFLLGIAYLEDGDVNNAEKYISQAIQINTYSYYVWWAEAKLYVQKNDAGKAIDYYKKAIILGGDKSGPIREEYIDFLILQKMESTIREQFDEALDFYSELDKNNEYVTLAYEAGEYQFSRGRTEEASEYVSLILSKDDDVVKQTGLSDEILLLRCELLIAERDYDAVDSLLSQFVDEAYRTYCEGLVLYMRNEANDAKNLFSKAIEKDIKGIVTEKAQKY
ncbi:MAG TPA: hypothetical protein PK957_02640 [Candidatus Dojkabacteria bacterium]|nr:hypothetical protein [Candidatus Dojkabacteria bacterium]HQF36624.1 hypothetical protein [Candidatus Dojkabacteria bacterium]